MARNIFNQITQRGVNAAFMEAMANAPEVFRTHSTQVSSTAPDENYVWLGTVPEPRQLIGDRELQNFNEFSFLVKNLSYEMTFKIDRESAEDDSLGNVNMRIAEAANVWANFRDKLFATLPTGGGTSTDTYTGTSFYNDSITIGQSTADNNITVVGVVDPANPTPQEILRAVNEALVVLERMRTDKNTEGFNRGATSNVRALGKPEYVRAFMEAMSSTIVPSTAGTASQDNPFGRSMLQGFDAMPEFPTATDAFYVQALGAPRGPFYYQERNNLEIVVMNSNEQVADNHGLKVLTYQRFRFAYGEHRRSVRVTLTT